MNVDVRRTGDPVSDGPRGTHVLHPLDVVGLDVDPDTSRRRLLWSEHSNGVELVCSRVTDVAGEASDCRGGYQTARPGRRTP